MRAAEIDSVKDLVINQGKILTKENSFALSWTMPEKAKRILATKVVLASDEACTKEVTAVELEIQQLTQKFSDIKNGIYYGCVFANAKSAGYRAAKNNGIRIVVETAAPEIQSLADSLFNRGQDLDSNIQIKAISDLRYSWTKVSGPSELTCSDENTAAPTFKASINGTYTVSVTVTNEVGTSATKTLTITIDTTTPTAPATLTVPAYSNSSSVSVTFAVGTNANMSTHIFKACSTNDCSSSCLDPIATKISPVTMSSLVSGSAYFICGKAVDLAGNASAFSFTPTKVMIDTTPPNNPTSVSVPASSAASFNIVFTAGAEANPGRFKIKACTNSACNAGCVGAAATAASPGTIATADLTLGTAYYGCVQGVDLAGNSSGFAASASTVVYNLLKVTYNAMGNTSGTVPTDATGYASGATVTVLGNFGNLTKSGYTFGGWNTASNAGIASTSFIISSNANLYAQWLVDCGSLAGGTYVMVPGDNIYGTSSFFVQKYAPSNVASVPTSQTGTTPWVVINQ